MEHFYLALVLAVIVVLIWGDKYMSNFVWCHGPSCHKSHTQDRIRGVKGSKVLRTKKVTQDRWNSGEEQVCILIFVVKVVIMTLLIHM